MEVSEKSLSLVADVVEALRFADLDGNAACAETCEKPSDLVANLEEIISGAEAVIKAAKKALKAAQKDAV